MNEKIKVSVIGASGFTGKELVRLLSGHKYVEIDSLLSRSFAGKDINDIHPSLKGTISKELKDVSIDNISDDCNVVFLALPHTKSFEYVPQLLKDDRVVIDLSADYRFSSREGYEKWYEVEHTDSDNIKNAVYGIPEINREDIKGSKLIANPGCYATSAILALYPLLKEGIVDKDVFVDAKSGISGAGKKLNSEFLYSKRYENLTPYKVNSHRHMGEIEDFLSKQINHNWESLVFCPHLIPMYRGILANTYAKVTKKDVTYEQIKKLYIKYYGNENFINIKEENEFPEVQEVNMTNNCNIGIQYDHKSGGVIVISAIDNLVKGASGQAIQNMNVVMGFDEKEGLI
jgi:N-acetyl-gamma-glutamyl-phosphate reductase